MEQNTKYYVERLEIDDNLVTTECENISDVLQVVAYCYSDDIVTVFDSDYNEIAISDVIYDDIELDANPYDDYTDDAPLF